MSVRFYKKSLCLTLCCHAIDCLHWKKLSKLYLIVLRCVRCIFKWKFYYCLLHYFNENSIVGCCIFLMKILSFQRKFLSQNFLRNQEGHLQLPKIFVFYFSTLLDFCFLLSDAVHPRWMILPFPTLFIFLEWSFPNQICNGSMWCRLPMLSWRQYLLSMLLSSDPVP